MGKKQPWTPISQIKGCFRILTLRCREAHAVRKRDGNTCIRCKCKQSVAKGNEVQIHVHHTRKPNWDRIITAIREELLDPNHMVCLCKECHELEHMNDELKWNQKKTEDPF